ncbi:MAG: Cache 3/Cache 2 fusion domain-containing protein [Deltaproteobacteria bacterium]|nr:Cache 3/Cache 2 fusion domain-containing protein [Deltaproteobacteria bacterium]
MTLQNKTAIIVASLITLMLGCTGMLYLYYLETSLRNSAYSGLESISEAGSQAVSRFLQDTRQEIKAIVISLDRSAITNKHVEKIENQLHQMVAIFPKFQNGMFVLDADGHLWVDYPPHEEIRGVDLSFRQYYKETMKIKKGVMGEPYRSVRTGLPVLTFTEPIWNDANNIIGLIGCSVQLNSPQALQGIQQTRIGKNGYIYIFNKSRTMILHPENERILSMISEGRNKLFDAAIKGFEGVGETVNSLGIPMLIALKQVPNSNWIIGAQRPIDEAFAPIMTLRQHFIIIILSSVIASIIFVSIAIRSIVRPLVKLRKAAIILGSINSADSLVSGNRSDCINELDSISSSDEIGELAHTFKDLCMKLDSTLVSLKSYAADWERTFNSVSDSIFIVDNENKILRMNRAAVNLRNIKAEYAVGQSFSFLMYGNSEIRKLPFAPYQHFISGKPIRNEIKGNQPDDIYEITSTPLTDADGNIIGAVHIVKEVTEAKRSEKALLDREQELQIKSKNLEEANIALKVLLAHKDDVRIELEEKVLFNVKELVVPYIDKLKITQMTSKQQAYLSIIETNLNEIVSSFSCRLSSKYFNLNPKEILVANLIREGKTNKEICNILNVSLRTVEFYRESIRRKLGLTNTKITLRARLLELASSHAGESTKEIPLLKAETTSRLLLDA